MAKACYNMVPDRWHHFLTGPYFLATAPCLSKLFLPLASAQAVRIKLAVQKLAQLARQCINKTGRPAKVSLFISQGLVCGGSGRTFVI